MRQFLVSPDREEAGLAPSWAAGVAQDGKDEDGPNGGGWVYTAWWRGRQNGNPGQDLRRAILVDRRDFLKVTGVGSFTALRAAETRESSGRSGKHYFYDFHGSPFGVGLQHGKALRQEIHQEAQPSLDRVVARTGGSQESTLARVVARYEGLYREHMPALLEEIHGIAEGAKVSYPYAFFAATHDSMQMGACTSFVCSRKRVPNEHVLMGQTKDTLAPLKRFRIMRISYSSGRKMLILNYPGWIGNLAVTSDSMCFTGNALHALQPPTTSPGSFLKRLIMERPSVEAVLNTVKGMAFGNGCYTIADRTGRAVCLEFVEGHVGFRDISGQVFGHANSVLMPEMKVYERAAERCASSDYRQKNLDRLLDANSRDITIDVFKQVTRNHEDFPLSICRHPSPREPETTNAAFVADVTAQEMHIAIGNPCVARFEKYSLVA